MSVSVWRSVLWLLGGGVVVEGVERRLDGVVARVRPRANAPWRCGRCRARARLHDRGEGRRRWRHLDACGQRMWVEAEAPRVWCQVHGKTVALLPWARHGAGHTRAFDAKVCWMVVRMSKTAVRQLLRIGWATVGAIVDRFVAEADAAARAAGIDRLDRLGRIGIDEVSYRKGHKYLLVVVDHDRRELVWAAVGRNKATLAEFFDLLGPERCARLTHISSDCAGFIAETIAARVPHAVHAADPFHIVAWASEALDQVRRRIWNTVRKPTGRRRHTDGSGEGKRIKDLRWALWKNPEDLTDNQHAVLAWLTTAHPELHRAYQYKERLRLILKLPAQAADRALPRWIKAAKLSRIPEIRDLAFKIQRHQDKILASIEHDLSNGLIEAVNTRIRLLIRQAYGFKRIDHLIALVKLALGGYHTDLPWNPHNYAPSPRM